MADDIDAGLTQRGFAAGQTIFGRYKLEKILGRGATGIVWLAHDEKLEGPVALKVLPDSVLQQKAALDELKRETRRNLDLTHPHIVRIFDFVADGQHAAIAMEYVSGTSLAARKLEQPRGIFPVEDIRRWVHQLIPALVYAHESAQVVHRDLKPGNILIDAGGNAKIADFGLARGLQEAAGSNTTGTPAYMSPEQLLGEKSTVSDDIYSFGATLYELLTGKPPFYSGNIALQVQYKVPPRIPARRQELEAGDSEPVPAQWEATIATCLAKAPEERPLSMRALLVRLEGDVVAGALLRGVVTAPKPAAPPPVVAPLPPPVAVAPPPPPAPVVATPITPPAVPPPAPVTPAPVAAPAPAPVAIPPPPPVTTVAPEPVVPPPPPAPVVLAPVPPPPVAPPPVPPPTPVAPAPVAAPAPAPEPAVPPSPPPVEPVVVAPPPAPLPPPAVTPPPTPVVTAPVAPPPAAVGVTPAAPEPIPGPSAIPAPIPADAVAPAAPLPAPVAKAAAPVPAPRSSVRYGAEPKVARVGTPRETKPAKPLPWKAIAVAAVVLLLGGGYYFVLHVPGQKRAAEAAAKAADERRLLNLRLDEERQQAEQARLALEARQTELTRLLEEQRDEQARRDEAERLRLAEQERLAQERAQREAERLRLAEQLRLAEERAQREAEANARGGVLVNSIPAGAEVFMDGQPAGKTPLALRDRRVGAGRLVLRLPGHREWSGSVEIKAGDFAEITATLEAEAAPGPGPGTEPETFTINQLDRAPVPRTRVAPEYPFNLRRAEVRGEVLVEFVVDPTGNVIAAYPVRSTNAGFDAAAVAAVQQWKFQPGMKGGKAVNAKLRVPIVFNLND